MRGWYLGVLAVCAVACALPSACSTSSDEPPLTGTTAGPGGADADVCATPSQGCSCATVGQSIPCGRVDKVTDGFKLCSYGTRVCGDDQQWGACTGTTTTQSLPLTTGASSRRATHALDLGVTTTCVADPCDPYCNTFIDTPVGITPPGFTMSDGGLVVAPPDAGDAGMVAPGTLGTTSNGMSSCTGGTNLIGTTTCDTSPYTSCQQDSRCDGASHMCVWNGGQGYYDPSAGGPDLEIGAACGDGSGAANIPVCNRGSTTIVAGTVLGVNFTASAVDGCTSIGVGDCTTGVPTGGLAPGQCLNLACTVPAGDAYAVINAGGGRDLTEPALRCGNNGADVQTVGAPGCAACVACNTTVTGTVYDPGSNVGLANVTVYELAGTTGSVPPIVDNVGGATDPPCDSCASLLPPSTYTVAVNTDSSGNFSLPSATPGTQQKIVAQSGRWRRAATVNVAACGSTSVVPDQIRMPKNAGEGDIPKIALAMGERESSECWLEKMGISTSEISRYTTGGTNRIQLFRTNGMVEGPHDSYSGGTPDDPNADLWSPTGALNDFSAILLPCESRAANPSSAAQARMLAYANAGGRVFMDHQPGHEWIETNWPSVSTWQGDHTPPGDPAQGLVGNSPGPQQDFYNWLAVWAPYSPGPGVGYLESQEPRSDALMQSAATTEWVRGSSTNSWPGAGDYALSFSFETPLGAASTCGRVMYNGMHVSQSRAHNSPYVFNGSEQFPQNCDLSFPLTAEEKALEYQFFQLTACALGGAPATVPPPPPMLVATTFYRDFKAVCDVGFAPVWQIFTWDALAPLGTNILFRAASAPADVDGGPGLLPPPPPAGDPVTVSIGDVATTPLPPPHTVDYYLQHPTTGAPQTSQDYLRVYMTFQPLGLLSPVLLGWQQFYDCVPDQ